MAGTCEECSAEALNKPALYALLILVSLVVSSRCLCPAHVTKLYNKIEWDKLRVAYINFSILTTIPGVLDVQFPEPVRMEVSHAFRTQHPPP